LYDEHDDEGDDVVREKEHDCMSIAHWSVLTNVDAALTGSDVMSSSWQQDAATAELLMTTLKPAVIPTVVESERVTDDDDEWYRHDVLELLRPPPPSSSSSSSASVPAVNYHRCVDVSSNTHHVHYGADADTDCYRPATVVQQGTLVYSAFGH